MQRFKERHGVVYRAIVGEGAAVNQDMADKWLTDHLDKVFQYSDRDIYNADETGLFYQMLPNRTHTLKGDKCVGGKNSKVRVTVLLCCNMDGSDRRLPFVIGKSKKPTCFGQFVPVRYRHNKKAWMTRELFGEWLKEFDDDMQAKKRKILLILDNCSAHHLYPKLQAIEILFLPPNATARLQPLDMGIIQNFKVIYRRRVIQRLLIMIRCPLPGNPKLQINLWMAVQMLKGAWMEIRSETLSNCFRKAGFVRPSASPAEVEGEEAATPDDREEVGQAWKEALEARLVDEADNLEDFIVADKDVWATEELDDAAIVREVRAAAGREEAQSSSDDDDGDEDAPPPQAIGTATALEYITALKDLVFARGLPEEYACHLDNLGKTVKPTMVQKQTAITSFFFFFFLK